MRLGRRDARHERQASRRLAALHDLLHFGRHHAAGPCGDDRADGRDLLHLGRDVLRHRLAGLEHDALVVDRVDHSRRRQETEVHHDRRRGGIEQRDVEGVGGGRRAAGEVPLSRGGALAGRLGPPQAVVHGLGDSNPAARRDHGLGLPRARREGGDRRHHHAVRRDGHRSVRGGSRVGCRGDARVHGSGRRAGEHEQARRRA